VGLWVGCGRGSVGEWVSNVQGGQLPREQDNVLVKDIPDDCVANGGDTHCWVGFDVALELLLFVFL